MEYVLVDFIIFPIPSKIEIINIYKTLFLDDV